jgi:hypothetical protein
MDSVAFSAETFAECRAEECAQPHSNNVAIAGMNMIL